MGRHADLSKNGVVPCLAVVIVGDDPASHVYVGAKERACARLGIRSVRVDVAYDAEYEEVASTVRRLNEDPSINGVLVQSPPSGMDEIVITDLIDPQKDVDGFHTESRQTGSGRCKWVTSRTPAGVMDARKYRSRHSGEESSSDWPAGLWACPNLSYLHREG